MELDDIKTTWNELNSRLEQQQQLNEKLVQKMIREKSLNKLRTIAIMEYFNLAFFIFLFFFTIPRYYMLNHNVEKISFFIMLIISFCGGLFSILLIRKVYKISYFKASVVESLRHISELKILFNKNKIIIYTVILPYTFSFLIVLDPMLLHRGFLEHYKFFITPLIFGMILALVSIYLIYKKLYQDKIDEAENMLNDLNANE